MVTFEDLDADVVALAEKLKPDVVLLDVHQKTNGLDLLRSLKSNPATQNIRVILMSGDDDAADRAEARSAGAEDYILKPFGMDVMERLMERIRNWSKAAGPQTG